MTTEFPSSVCWQYLGIVVAQTEFVLQSLVQVNYTEFQENYKNILRFIRGESGFFVTIRWQH
jgi:hypothetical protein